MKKQMQRYSQESTLQIGDVVALKERREEMGSIVMKNQFVNGPLIGRVVKIHEIDKGHDSHERKHYTVELIANGVDSRSGGAAHKNPSGLCNLKLS